VSTQGDPHVGEHLEAAPKDVLHDCDLIRRLGCGHASFYLRKARGEFKVFELDTPHAARRTEYSAHLVNEWFRTGERPVRFFRNARASVIRTGKPGRPRKLRPVT
jgi:hypothetical protein